MKYRGSFSCQLASVPQIQTELSKNCAVCGLEQNTFCSLLTSPPPKIERSQLIQTGLWLEKSYTCHSLQYLAWLCSIPPHFSNHVRKWRKKEKQKNWSLLQNSRVSCVAHTGIWGLLLDYHISNILRWMSTLIRSEKCNVQILNQNYKPERISHLKKIFKNKNGSNEV